MTLDINCELLFIRLVFGFFLFTPSFPAIGAKRMLSSPKTGVRPEAFIDGSCKVTPLRLVSFELLDSFSLSLILYVPKFDRVLVDVLVRYSCCGNTRGFVTQVVSLMLAFGGVGVVARGLGLTTGAS